MNRLSRWIRGDWQIKKWLKSKLNTLSKFKYQAISVDEIKVTKHGEMTSYGKSVPYARFNAKINRLPIGDVSGIISVAETKDGDARILISANEKSKYSQLISEEFFKNIKQYLLKIKLKGYNIIRMKKEFEHIVTILSKKEISKEDFNILMNSQYVKHIKEMSLNKYQIELDSGEIFFVNTPLNIEN